MSKKKSKNKVKGEAYVCHKSRVVLLNSDVRESSISSVIKDLITIQERDNEHLKKEKGYVPQPVTLLINTPGGSCDDGKLLMDYMANYHVPIHTHVSGMAASMGVYIFLAGSKRTITPLGILMWHDVSYMAWGSHETIKQGTVVNERYRNELVAWAAKRSGVSVKKLTKPFLSKTDWYIFGEEAVKLGFATEVTK